MSYNRENYIKICREYSEKNLRAKEAAEKKANKLRARFPELAAIDSELAETGFKIFAEATKGAAGLDERINKLRRENEELQRARAMFLESKGYPADCTSVKYECEKCSDTGFIGNKMCDCMRRSLVLAGYESSGIGKLIRTQSFETFNLKYYNQSPEQRKNMEHNLQVCKSYAESFSPESGENLLLCGTTGLGKTHLSTSIAKVVIESGNDVVYDTAQNIMSDFEYERFVRNHSDTSESRTEKYFDCDLLIIDDLGTEVINQFSISCLYNIINTRLNHRRPMIINTNLLQGEIREKYSDRITSRLFGEFTALLFYGKDIRQLKVSGFDEK